MTRRPNTNKMLRLLETFSECRLQERKQLRELQEDTRKVLGLEVSSRPKLRKKR